MGGGRRVTSKYRLKISPREDQIGECGSISFQGGPRGNMDARITPFGSHGVPLWSAFEAPQASLLQVYIVFWLLRTEPTQHRVCTKAPKLRGSGDNKAIILKFDCVFLLPKMQPTQNKLSTKSLKLQGPRAQKHFY